MTRYLTPDAIEPGNLCRVIRLPANPNTWGVFSNALLELTKPYNWVKHGEMDPTDVARYFTAWLLEYHKSTFECDTPLGCGDEENATTCQDYSPRNSLIRYRPYNPFIEPDKVVDPYPNPIWLRGENQWIPGAQAGDITFTFQAFIDNLLDAAIWVTENLAQWAWDGLSNFDEWLNSLTSNFFPRFNIRFTGKGTVDLHLLKVPLGGIAYITVDGNPIGKFVPLTTFTPVEEESWLNGLSAIGLGAITGSLIQVEIVQIPIETEGDHYIDVTFIPKIEISLPDVAIGWGGGLRKIEMCGVKPIFDTPPTRENTEENCLEWLNPITSEWECIASLDPDMEVPPTRENTEENCLEWLNPVTHEWECIASLGTGNGGGCDDCGDCGDTEDCDGCDDCEECGDWDDCDDCSEGGSGTVPVITYELNPEATAFRWFIDGQPGEWIPIPTGAQGEPGADGEPGPQGEQGPQGPMGGTPDYDWLHTFDFTASNHGFTVDSGSATWTTGVGWTGNNFGSSPNIRKILSLTKALSSARTITYLEWTVTQTFGVTANDSNRLNQMRLRTGTTTLNNGEDAPGTGIHTWAGSIAGVDNLRPTVANSVFATGQNGGSVILVKLKVGGLGTDPFS